jgi:hypothetical protein
MKNETSGKIRRILHQVVSSILQKFVLCRKIRGKTEDQRMADLPEDRITPGPPFTNVDIDTFGTWSIIMRRTRGGAANSKHGAIIFACLTTCSVQLEVIEDRSSFSFIDALRRFMAVRGSVKIICSDCGTN